MKRAAALSVVTAIVISTAAVTSVIAGAAVVAPSTPPALVCGNASVLSGPATAPPGSVIVPAGDDSTLTLNTPSTTYYFATGKHTLGSSEYSQIIPNNGDVYIGAPGAIIDGQGLNDSAFTNNATGVTIEYLTIQNFTPPGGQGAVNHNSGENWTIAHDTIQDNSPGAGMMIGSDDIVSGNCLTKNGEYGFNAYLDPTSASASSLTGGPVNVTLTGNEISDNNTYNWETVQPGCGCSGGGKFWKVDGATITGNYIHDNLGGAGIWADTDNTGFNISGNYFANNYGPAVEYEISYNAQITDNTFVDNAWGAGAANPGFPTGAIYASESGGDSRVPGYSSGSFSILNNTFTDNWSGVVLWESADRFCSSPSQPSADCVLTDPTLFYYNSSATAPGGCGEADLTGATPGTNSGTPPADYYDGCRWKTQNVTVASNTFDFTQANVPGCTLSANSCGENAIFSQYGTYPSWSPYKAYAVEDALTAHQDNVFSDNTYSGPWSFMYQGQSGIMTFAQWQAVGQDAASPVTTTTLPPPVTTTTLPPPVVTTTTLPPPVTTTTLPPPVTTTTTLPPPVTTTTTLPPPTTTTTLPPPTTTTTLPPPTTTTTLPPPTTTTTLPPPTTTTTLPAAQTDSVLASSANPSTVGGAVTFTATVAAGGSSSSGPTGVVAFTDNGKSISTCADNALTNSRTSCTVSFSTIGANSILASYSGNASYAPSTSGLLQETVSRGSDTRLLTSQNPTTVGRSVHFTALIGVGNGGAGQPTGAVDFTVNGAPIPKCTNMVVTNSKAACVVSFSNTGSASIVASYLGSPNYAPSTSSPLAETVGLSLTRWAALPFTW